jgi:hypothetical protein
LPFNPGRAPLVLWKTPSRNCLDACARSRRKPCKVAMAIRCTTIFAVVERRS